MNEGEFIQYCRSELRTTFEKASTGEPDDKLKYRTEGLINALRVLGLVTSEQLVQMMETEHIAVFKESIAERAKRRASLEELKEKSPDVYFDIPAFVRKP